MVLDAGCAACRAELSEGLATARMAELASLYVPLAAPADPATLPYLSYNPAVPYHTSAILATAIDTALLPVRLTGRSTARSSLRYLDSFTTSPQLEDKRLLGPAPRYA